MLWLYNILFPIGFLLFIPGMIVKLFRRPGHKISYPERFSIYSREKKQMLRDFQGGVWIHSVSVGETVIALNLIKEWQKTRPDHKFILSTTTTTGQEIAQNKAPKGVAVIFCPIDFIWFVRRAIKLIKPSQLVILETEIWPNLINQAKKYGARIALVNARMSDRSARGYYRFRNFFRPILEMFDLLCVQTSADRDRFQSIALHSTINVTGNMKFDQTVPTDLPDMDLSEYFGIGEHLILLAASTHPGEEELVAEAYNTIKPQFPDLKLIIVPRHAERGGEVAKILSRLEISFRQRSLGEVWTNPVDCLLADTTGEMLKFMNKADVVIMGKSLAGQNEGHNIIEPAMLGKAIVTGPVLKNFRFVMKAFEDRSALAIVHMDEELPKVLTQLFSDRELRENYGKTARQVTAGHRGATQKTIELLEEKF